MPVLLATLKPGLADHKDGSDSTFTTTASGVMATPPAPVEVGAGNIGGGDFDDSADLGAIAFCRFFVRTRYRTTAGDLGSLANPRIKWFQGTATISVNDCGGAAGTPTVTTANDFNSAGVVPGMPLSGAGIAQGATVLSIESSTSLTVSALNTGAVSGTVMFFVAAEEGAAIPVDSFGTLATSNRTIAPDGGAWTWAKINTIHDVTPGGAFYQDLEPAITQMALDCSESYMEVWGPDPAPPTAPSGLSAVAASSSAIGLSWSDNSSDETGFEVERSSSGSGGSFSLLITKPAGATSHQDSGLPASTEFCYRVRAVNGAGPSSYAGPACATTFAAPSQAPPANREPLGEYFKHEIFWRQGVKIGVM